MADTKKVNFALLTETVESIEKLAKQTKRGKSDVIDWLVGDAMDRIQQVRRETVTVEQAIESSVTPS